MNKTAHVLNVFLASPEDVKAERIAAEEIISDVDKFLAGNLGWNIRLHKWEDQPPAFGRPQQTLNVAVDNCDLFVGLLWERWGYPSGEYSSGFEEEFERARSRRKDTGQPEIWLLFKDVRPEKLKDQDDQLQKVLHFQKKMRSERELRYGETKDIEDWKRKLRNWLDNYILTITAQAAAPPQTPAVPPTPSALISSDAGVVSSEKQGRIPGQLLHASETLTRVLRSGDLEFSREDTKLLQEFEAARLFLLSATWMFRRYTGDTLRTHEMNLLYKHREQLRATAAEASQLFRALVADSGSVVPGWFWFEGMNAAVLRNSLFSLSRNDLAANVRIKALQYLKDAHIVLPKRVWSGLPLKDSDADVRIKAYEYLGSIGDESTAQNLEKIANTDEAGPSSAARDARLAICFRLKPKETATSLIQSGQYLSNREIARLSSVLSQVDADPLVKATDNPLAPMRGLAAKELSERGALSHDLARKLSQDTSVKVREIAFIELAKQGKLPTLDEVRKSLSNDTEGGSEPNRLASLLGDIRPTGDIDAVLRAHFASQPLDHISQSVDWFSREGRVAYETLAIYHYEVIKDKLREDLKDGFARVKRESLQKLSQQYGPSGAAKFDEAFKSLDDFIRSQLTEAALLGLLQHGEPSDVAFGREQLANTYSAVKMAAVRVVAKFGTREDAKGLLDVSEASWGEARDEAGAAALRLSENQVETAVLLTKSKSDKLLKLGFNYLYQQPLSRVSHFFEKLMEDEDELTRARAVYFFSKRLTRHALVRLLRGYLQRETYYYNVVTWLDRILYSPRRFRAYFIAELESEIT